MTHVMARVRKLVAVASVSALVVSLMATAASADQLADYLDRAHRSTYTATRLVVSVWGGQTEVSLSLVEHSDGMEMVRVDSTWSMIGDGKVMTMGETPRGLAFASAPEPISTDRYTIGDVDEVTHMGRTCELVTVMEGDTLRATFLLDVRTGAPLITETFTDTGKVFRRTSLQNFLAYRTYSGPADAGGAEYDIVMSVASDALPDSIFGYRLVDVSEAPGESHQGFYSDGLFSFSLFVLDQGSSVTGFESPLPFVTETGVYDVVSTAQDVRIHWADTENRFVLVGDLPPDHAASVLAELPEPDARSTFSRWWHRLFG